MHILSLFGPKIKVPRVIQETDSHCGPAVVQVLLAHLHKQVTQDQVVTAAKARSRLQAHGTRPDQLALAVKKLTPELQFWFKQNTKVSDLETLIHEHRWPVAVNWQGLFYDTEEEQEKNNPDDEHGHYSVVIDINSAQDRIVISDPYSDYAHKPRVFSLKWFEKRWWDIDHITNKKTGIRDSIHTKRLIFVIAPKDATFPKKLKMQLPDKLDVLKMKS